MLPLPNLDDRFYKQIVDEARKSIPKIIAEWTDENAHDPGITLIELFAWLTEMQQYYLNRITERNELKFLKLLGVRLLEASRARCNVHFSGMAEAVVLPQGTPLSAREQKFETEAALLLVPTTISRVIVRSEIDTNDFTASNRNKGVSYYAFAKEARQGNRMYIGFDEELPTGKDICLAFDLSEDYPVPVGAPISAAEDFIPSAQVSWKYFGADDPRSESEEKPSWLPVEELRDETLHLSQRGRVVFRIPSPMQATMIHPANDRGRYWVCCTLEQEGYEISPMLKEVSINTVSAIQQETFSTVLTFSGNGEPNQTLEVHHYLSIYGAIKVQVKESNGWWRYWTPVDTFSGSNPEQSCYTLSRWKKQKRGLVIFGDGQLGRVLPKGEDNVRIICHRPDFKDDRNLGTGSGLPDQRFKIDKAPVVSQIFLLQTGRKIAESGEWVWEDCTRVDDFDNSLSDDRHYMLDEQTGEVIFGNNERGFIPEAAERANICILSLSVGGGSRGNIKPGLITGIIDPNEHYTGISATNLDFAAGGAEKETIAQARLRVQGDLNRPYRTVSNEDFEQIARSTPGLRVARVKALPLYTIGLQDYPNEKVPAQVTVVVVPYSESETPVPSSGFLQTVYIHLNRHRLITSELHVVPPEYVQITVHAVIVTEPAFKKDSSKILDALHRLLRPLDHSDGSKGWEFGRTVYRGDVYGAINQIKGVAYIQDLWLDASGRGIRKDVNGDIRIPPHGLIYSGEHHLELISRSEL